LSFLPPSTNQGRPSATEAEAGQKTFQLLDRVYYFFFVFVIIIIEAFIIIIVITIVLDVSSLLLYLTIGFSAILLKEKQNQNVTSKNKLINIRSIVKINKNADFY
jgi:hypothetical protein